MTDIPKKIFDAGVVGAGGGGFPTHIKMQSKVSTVIANGAECEPLLKVDQQIMAIYADKVVRGVEIAMESTSADEGIIAIKEKYYKAISEIEKSIKKSSKKIKIHQLGNYYPAGDEFILMYDVTGKIIPEAGIPLQVGCVVDNVVTLLNITNAVDYNQPVTERPITVTGCVKNPKTFFVPIGTAVGVAVKFCGGEIEDDVIFIEGGPMMGRNITPSTPITKKTSGIIVLPKEHPISKNITTSFFINETQSACEQCQDCTEICPRYLLGHSLQSHILQRTVNFYKFDTLTTAYLCSECGLCEWVCPVRLKPRRVNQFIKKELIKKGIKNPHKSQSYNVREMFEFRRVPLERIMQRFNLKNFENPAKFTETSPEVEEVFIPLQQHTGIKANPKVSKNQKINKGDLIADIPEGKLGAKIHSSIDGTVVDVTDEVIHIKK